MNMSKEITNDIKFSVAMCLYIHDNPEHFDEALASIYNQSVKPNEVILVADGPITKELKDIIKKYTYSENLIVVYLPKNVGHGNARCISIEKCSNEIIALMDSDDISHKNRFEKQLKIINANSNIDVVGGYISEFMYSKENIISLRKVPENDFEIKKYLKLRCPFNQVTVMFKKSSVISAGNYIDWYNEEDYYLWIRMYLNNAFFYNLPETLAYVRVSNDMYKRRGGFKYFRSEYRLQKYMLSKKIIKFNIFILNITKRFILQVLVSKKIRSLLYKKYAREKV